MKLILGKTDGEMQVLMGRAKKFFECIDRLRHDNAKLTNTKSKKIQVSCLNACKDLNIYWRMYTVKNLMNGHCPRWPMHNVLSRRGGGVTIYIGQQ